MGTLRSGIVALPVLFGAVVAAVPAVADGGPPGFERAYYPSLWQGLYGGLHAGYGWSGDADGFVGGAQVGYNWQSQQFVYGIEGDISLSNIGIEEKLVVPGFGVVATASASIDWLATIRGRVGVLVQPRLLVYATAGLAIVNAEAKASVIGLPSVSVSDTDTGFVFGLGVESKWTDTTSVRVEYLGFGETSAVDSFGIIRVGVNFKFGQ